MTFGEKIRRARLSLNLSQSDLAEMTGISERSLYTYEQNGIMPRSGNVKKLADALNISVGYLLGEEDSEKKKDIERELFLRSVRSTYGYKGAKEAGEVLERASALFAGGNLDERAKDEFFQSLMEVYLESKADARAKYSPRARKSRKKTGEST